MNDDYDTDNGDSVSCPECKQEVYEDSPQCPSCGHYLSAADFRGASSKWVVVVVWVLITVWLLTFVF